LAILNQTVFSPRYGYNNLEDHMINSFLATGALAYGKIVEPAVTTGILALANDWGHFLMEEVVADDSADPTARMFDYAMGEFRNSKVASATTAVSTLIPRKGNWVRTKWVVQGAGGVAVAVGNLLDIVSGNFATNAGNNGSKGKLKNIYTDSLGNVLYDVEIL
jgi:hypothetical protein